MLMEEEKEDKIYQVRMRTRIYGLNCKIWSDHKMFVKMLSEISYVFCVG